MRNSSPSGFFSTEPARESKNDDGAARPRFSLMTGFIGTSWISKALSDNGLSELAYRILHNNAYSLGIQSTR